MSSLFPKSEDSSEANNKVRSNKGIFTSGFIFLVLVTVASGFDFLSKTLLSRAGRSYLAEVQALGSMGFVLMCPMMAFQLTLARAVATMRVKVSLRWVASFLVWVLPRAAILGITYFFILALLTGFLGNYLHIQSGIIIPLFFLYLGLLWIVLTIYGFLQGLKRFLYLGILMAGFALGRMLLTYFFVTVFSLSTTWAITTYVLPNFIIFLLAIPFVRSLNRLKGSENKPGITGEELKYHLHYYWIMLFSLLAVYGLKYLPLVLSKHYLQDAAGELYSLMNLGEIFYLFALMISSVMFPYVVERTERERNTRILLLGSMGVMLVITLVGTFFVAMFPDILVRLFGPDYSVVQGYVPVIGLVVLPLSWLYILNQYFLARHRVGFMWCLYLGIIIQVLLIMLLHRSIVHFLLITTLVNLFFCGVLVLLGLIGSRRMPLLDLKT